MISPALEAPQAPSGDCGPSSADEEEVDEEDEEDFFLLDLPPPEPFSSEE